MQNDKTELDAVQRIVDARRSLPGALMVILHEIQEAAGYIPDAAVPVIASALNRSQAEIQGVISFYPHFHSHKTGRHVLEVCRAESCQAMGGVKVEAAARALLGIDWHETTADGAVTLEPVYCLGNCACSPSIRIGDDIHGRVSADTLSDIVDELRKS